MGLDRQIGRETVYSYVWPLQLDFPVPVYFSCGICGNESTFNLIA